MCTGSKSQDICYSDPDPNPSFNFEKDPDQYLTQFIRQFLGFISLCNFFNSNYILTTYATCSSLCHRGLASLGTGSVKNSDLYPKS